MKNNNFVNDFLIFKVLLSRNFRVIFSSWIKAFFNAFASILFQFILFAIFLPAMGMSKELVAPLFIGTFLYALLSIAYARLVVIAGELEFDGLILYHQILPFHRNWLLAVSVVGLIIELFLTTIPLLVIGKLLLGDLLNLAQMQIFSFFIFYLLVTIFMSIFFHSICYGTTFVWFIDCIWPRCLTPLQVLGCSKFPWYAAFSISPLISRFLLLNPVTYVTEGMRSAILGTSGFISLEICFSIIALLTVILSFLLSHFFKKRLDPI
jgi:hypothetical protein